MRSMKVIQNYHNEHTKFNFGMLIVVILYEFHTLHFAVWAWFWIVSIAGHVSGDGYECVGATSCQVGLSVF